MMEDLAFDIAASSSSYTISDCGIVNYDTQAVLRIVSQPSLSCGFHIHRLMTVADPDREFDCLDPSTFA